VRHDKPVTDDTRPPPIHGALMETIARVIVEPYKVFFAQMYAAGRVTDAELTTLHRACEAQVASLGTLVDKALVDVERGDASDSGR
jgi:hypothetical protein